MRETIVLNKPRLLWGKLLIRLKELEERSGNRQKNRIEWADVYEKLCRGFSIRKAECREIIFLLNDLGLIEISSKGIKLLYRTKNG